MVDEDPAEIIRGVHEVVLEARDVDVSAERVLAALASLRSVREQLGAWEPELVAAARASGVSWASLAPALGVASRQAAERRFLRLRPSTTGESTGEARVDAERGRRAGDRAVADWARHNSAILRQLAGQVSALGDLDAAGRRRVDQLTTALGDDDVTGLLSPLAAVRPHLTHEHAELTDRLGAISDHTDKLRRDAADSRRNRTT